jgi:hypothetical protein
MTVVEQEANAMWGDTSLLDAFPTAEPDKLKRRRIPGIRVKSLPSAALLLQECGAATGLFGVYLQFGAATMLIVAGVALVTLGTLKEAGRI